MSKPKIIGLIELLSEGEKQQLTDWLEAEARPQERQLWSSVYQQLAKQDRLDREALHQQLYPGTSFRQKVINDRLSELNLRIEAFMAQRLSRASHPLPTPRMVHLLLERGQVRWAERQARRRIRQLEKQSFLSAQDATELRDLHESLYTLAGQLPAATSAADLEAFLHYQELAYLLVRFKYLIDAYARTKTFAEKNQEERIQQLLRQADALPDPHSPLLRFYRSLLDTYCCERPTTAQREQLETTFMSLSPGLPLEDQSFLLIKLVNLASQSNRQGADDALAQLFRLYRYGAESGLFLTQGYFSEATFINICVTAAGSGHFSWGHSFWQRFQSHLRADGSASSKALALASLYFHDNRFAEAYQTLRAVATTDVKHRFRRYSLYVRCLLEMSLQDDSYYPTLRAAITSFRQLLKRDRELSRPVRQAYRHFLTGIYRLARLSERSVKPAIQQSYASWLAEVEPIISKNWLEKKARQVLPALSTLPEDNTSAST